MPGPLGFNPSWKKNPKNKKIPNPLDFLFPTSGGEVSQQTELWVPAQDTCEGCRWRRVVYRKTSAVASITQKT